ncbi:MAG: MotA/TolQ/ExbB proton channel family protein [Verrucomicrobiota bacterium]
MTLLLHHLREVLADGGLTLWALLALALALYGMIAATWSRLSPLSRQLPPNSPPPSPPSLRPQVHHFYATWELDRLAWVQRRLPQIGVLIAAAPLAGLLGTVGGMLQTFRGMAIGRKVDQFEAVSLGISQALVTTQAGLVIALPATFLLLILRRQTERLKTTLEAQLHRDLSATLLRPS